MFGPRKQSRRNGDRRRMAGRVGDDTWRPLAPGVARISWIGDVVPSGNERLAEREQIEVDEDEIDAKIKSLAGEQGVDAATLERAAGDADLRRAMSAQLVDEKALAFLAGKAKVEGTTDS